MEYPKVDLEALERSVQASIERDRGPRARLRELSRPARFALVAFVVVLEVAFAFFTSRRRDWDVYPALRMGLSLMALGGALGLALWDALRPLHQPARDRRPLIAAGLLLPVVLAFLPEVPTLAADRGLAGDLRCLTNGALLALAVLGASWLVARDGRFLLLGAVGGALTGLTALTVECPTNLRQHLVVGHALVAPLLVGAAWTVERTLRRG